MRRWAAYLALGLALPSAAAAQSLSAAFFAPPVLRVPHVAAESVGRPFPGARAQGILAFRGNPTRSWYGTGPLPDRPEVLWKRGPYCGLSTDAKGTRTWCGTGWTGQPAVRETGRTTEVIFGAYDHAVHFLDAATGADLRRPFRTGDIIKGSVSLDPSGAPLLYVGSRDNHLRVLRLDEGVATELWRLSAITGDGVWNNDWDANPLVLGDVLLAGSENSWFYAIRLNRRHDAEGRATVAPEVVNRVPGFTRALFRDLGDRMVSIESSPTVVGDRVYFANSGGLVQGYALDRLLAGAPRAEALVFAYHAGDDVDATLVADADGMLYAAVEDERPASEAKRRAGQLLKLDPTRPADPLVWSLRLPGRVGGKGGIWATPALYRGHLYVTTHQGALLVVDAATGRVTAEFDKPWHGWSSPVVVAGELLVADCEGTLWKYGLADPARPRLRWRYDVPGAGCWESTPAVWRGVIYLGNRDGHFYAIGEGRTTERVLDVALQ